MVAHGAYVVFRATGRLQANAALTAGKFKGLGIILRRHHLFVADRTLDFVAVLLIVGEDIAAVRAGARHDALKLHIDGMTAGTVNFLPGK